MWDAGYTSGTSLGDGRILVAGGQGNRGALSSAEVYDPVIQSWGDARDLASRRQLPSVTLLCRTVEC